MEKIYDVILMTFSVT